MGVQRQLRLHEQRWAVATRVILRLALLDQVLLRQNSLHNLILFLSILLVTLFATFLILVSCCRCGRTLLWLCFSVSLFLSSLPSSLTGIRKCWFRFYSAPLAIVQRGICNSGLYILTYSSSSLLGSSLMMGNKGSLSTPCSCFSLNNF